MKNIISQILLVVICLVITCSASAQSLYDRGIQPADASPEQYVYMLKDRRVALLINQTSVVDGRSLVDILLGRKVNVMKILVPEHGFRGTEDAGAQIDNSIDSATGLPVVSLYGSHHKPTAQDLADVDIVVYDLQDVGARFYTYISTLQYVIEACAQNQKLLLILDRPDPNGWYVDGPVLDTVNRSFVGMQPIPIVYGMTPGEYAHMLVGERWVDAGNVHMKVIRCTAYDHNKKYELPVWPSPNLRSMAAIFAYPSVCLFEGTALSVGRGTDKPFQQYGAPALAGKYKHTFTPVSSLGSRKPPHENETCYGELVGKDADEVVQKINGRIRLDWVIEAYKAYPDKDKFFTPFFTTLAGTATLVEQIKRGASEAEIRESWEKDLTAFRKIRKKYLLYGDF